MNEIQSEIQQPRRNNMFAAVLASAFMGMMAGAVAVCAVLPSRTATCILQPIAAEPVIWEVKVPPSDNWTIVQLWADDGGYELFPDCGPSSTLLLPVEPVVPDFQDGPRPFLQ